MKLCFIRWGTSSYVKDRIRLETPSEPGAEFLDAVLLIAVAILVFNRSMFSVRVPSNVKGGMFPSSLGKRSDSMLFRSSIGKDVRGFVVPGNLNFFTTVR